MVRRRGNCDGVPPEWGEKGLGGWLGLATSILAFGGLGLVALATPSQAQVLVSNFNQTASVQSNVFLSACCISTHAQEFSTGPHAAGYTVTSVELALSKEEASDDFDDLSVSLWTESSGIPGTKEFDFTVPGTIADGSATTFAAPANKTVGASTDYFIVVSNHSGSTSGGGTMRTTFDNGEDTGGASGWSINDHPHSRTILISSMAEENWFHDSSSSRSLVIKINGAQASTTNNAATGKPAISGKARVGETLTAAVGTIADTDGLPTTFPDDYTIQWTREDSDGSNKADISGATSGTYTPVAADVGKKIRVKASFSDDDSNSEGPLTSDAWPGTGTVKAAVTVSSIAVTSTPAATSDTYGVGEKIRFTVTFSEEVNVSAGRPHFNFALGPSSNPVTTPAPYESGTGSTALVFAYTVQAGDSDPNGIWIRSSSENTLVLETGEYIRAASDAADAVINFADQGGQSGHKVDGSLAVGVVVDPTTLTVVEEATGGTYTVKLGTQPSAGVTVTPTSGDTGAATLSPAALTFTTSNWSTAQTITVTGVMDTDTNDETVTVTHAVTSTDSDYAALPAPSVTVTVTDDDTANSAATGKPAISGKARVGETLTAAVGTIADTDGLPTTFPDDYTIQWTREDSDGSNKADISGATSGTYTPVADDVGKKIRVEASFTDDASNSEGPLTSDAWPGTGTVKAAVTVSSVAVTSTPAAASDTYGLGEKIRFTVTFSEEVNVSTGANQPHFEFSLGPSGGGVVKEAAYESGTGTTALVFAYTVQASDMDPNGIWIGDQDDTLDLDTGEYIRAVSDQADAVLTHSALSTQSGHKVDGSLTAGVVVSTTALTVDEGSTGTYTVKLATLPTGSVTVTPTSADTGAATVSPAALTFTTGNWNTNQTITVSGEDDIDTDDESVTVSHAVSGYTGVTAVASVTVTVTDDDIANSAATGKPAISGKARVGQTLTAAVGTIADTDGLPTTFPDDYTLQWTREDADGMNKADISGATSGTYTPVAADVGKKIRVEASFTDDASNSEGPLTSDAWPGTGTVKAAVTVSSIAVTSTPAATSDTYGVGEKIRFTVTFSEEVNVSAGRPHFNFALGPSSNPVTTPAPYESGTGTTALVFAYTVLAGDSDPNGIWIRSSSENTLVLETDEYIRAVSDAADAVINFADQGGQSNHKVNGSLALGVVVDPTTLTIDEGGNGTYTVKLGTQPSASVTVTPGLSTADATKATLSPTTALTFTTSTWNTAQTVTVSGDQDTDANDETVTVTHAVTSTDSDYAALSAPSVTVTVDDDENANSAATGKPAISGKARVGETLTAAVGDVADTDGLPTTFPDDYTLQWTREDSDGSNKADISGATSGTYTPVAADVGKKIRVKASFSDDASNSEGPLESEALPGTGTVKAAVTVSSVAVTSTPAATSDTYGVGEKIRFTVTFSEEVNVSTGANQPHFEFSLGPSGGGVVKEAAYESGTGGTALVFAYTVQASDMDPNGIWIGDQDDTLDLDTGEYIRAVSDAADAVLTHSAPSTQANHKVNGSLALGVVVSTTALTVVEEATGGTYTVKLGTQPSAGVTVTPTSGDTGAATLSPAALTFTTSNWSTAQTITVTGVMDTDTNDETVTVTHAVTSTDSDYAALTAPSVTVTVTDDDSANSAATGKPAISGKARVGQTLTAAVGTIADTDGLPTTFPDDYTIQWTREDLDGSNKADISGATSGTYTPVAADVGKKIRVKASFSDDASNSEGPLESEALPGTGTVKAAVTVSSVAVTSTPAATSDTYGVGEKIRFTVTFSEEVNVSTGANQPHFEFSLGPSGGGVDTRATYESGSGGTMLVFAYTVQAGDSDDNGIWIGNQSRTLKLETGEYIRAVSDAADAVLTHSAPSTQANHKVNGSLAAGVVVSPTTLTVAEGSTGTYTVKLGTLPTANVTVTPTSADTGAATVSAALTFTTGNWNTAQTVTVSGVDDGDANDETVTISHGVSGYATVTTADGVTVTVTDQDHSRIINDTAGVTVDSTTLSVNEGGSGTYTVVLDTQPSGDVTVTPSSSDATAATVSPATLTFTNSNWDTAKTMTVSGEDDTDSNNETVTISHSVEGYGSVGLGSILVTTADAVTVTVSDNDTPGVNLSPATLSVDEGGSGTYVVKLNTLPTGNVTITSSSGDTGAATVSPATLTFTTSNWDTAKTVTVSGAQDDDANDETVTISHSVSGYATVTTADDVTVTVNDDETAGVRIDPTPLTVTEGGSGTYTVKLNTLPTGNVTITPSSGDTGAATVSPATLTFTNSNWDTAKTVTVSGEDDSDTNNETVTISHSVSGYGSVTADDVTVTVDDDDSPPPQNPTPPITPDPTPPVIPDPTPDDVSLSATTLRVDEGGSQTYTVELKIQPGGDVTITPSSSATANATVVPPSLTFTTANWNTAQTVTVRGVPDDDANNETVTIRHGVRGYGSVTTANGVTVTVDDDDTAGVTVDSTRLTVTEGGSDTYTVKLDTQPSGNVTVTPSSGDAMAATVSPATLTFTASNWDTAKTVTVRGVEDADASNETVTVRHRVSGYGSVTTAKDVTVTVNDDGWSTSEDVLKGLLPRFGRSVAQQVLDRVSHRLQRPSPPPGLDVSVAGEGLSNRGPWEEQEGIMAKLLGFEPISEGQLVEGTEFAFSPHQQQEHGEGEGEGEGDRYGNGNGLSFWGGGDLSSFSSQQGDISLSSDVTTALVAADWHRQRWQAGAAVAYGWGKGSYEESSSSNEGSLNTNLTGLFPYGSYALNDHLSIWGVVGHSWGHLTLSPEGAEQQSTDIRMAMGALGLDGLLLDGGEEGLTIRSSADALLLEVSSEETQSLAGEQGQVSRLRLGLEAERPFPLPHNDAVLTPSVELGLRRDAVDAQTGVGMDLAAALRWSDPLKGMEMELRGRTMVSHGEQSFHEQGLGLSLSWDPNPSSSLGLSLSLSQSMGASAASGSHALLVSTPWPELTASGSAAEGQQQFAARMGYGFLVYKDALLITPEVGVSLSSDDGATSLGFSLSPYSQQGDEDSWKVILESQQHINGNGDNSANQHPLDLRFSLLF